MVTTASGASVEDRHVPTRRVIQVMIPLCIADLVSGFETSMVYSAFKTLLEEFGDPVQVGWLVTAYLLVSAGSAAVIGRLGDMFGRRRVLIAVLAIAIAGSIVSAVAQSLPGIIVGRGIQGVALGILPLCFGLIREHLAPRQVAFCVGIITATTSVGTTLGLIGGGAIVDHFNWRGIFIASAAFGAAALALSAWLLPRSTTIAQKVPIDWPGALLFPTAVALLLYALSYIPEQGFSDPLLLVVLGLGLALLIAWWRHELRARQPLFDLRLMTKRPIALAFACLMLAALGSMQVIQFFMLLLQQPSWTGIGLDLSATAAGLLKLPTSAVMIVAAPVAGWLCGRYGGRAVIAGGMLLCTLAWGGVLAESESLTWIVLMLTVCGLGIGVAYTGIPNVVIAAVPPERVSEATGMLSVLRAIGSGAGAQLLATMLASSTVSNAALGPGTFPSGRAYALVLVVFILLSLAAALAAAAIPKGGTRRVATSPVPAAPA